MSGSADSTSMAGYICMVTGASSGIGKETAAGLASRGATVVMVCRDEARGTAAREDVAARTGARQENLDLMIADLSSLDAVRLLVSDFSTKYKELNVLVNNAGLILAKRGVTKDGFETTFEVNYLSHFLLTNLLLPALKAGAPARIINVSSDAHTSGHINFDDLQGERKFSGMGAYCQSKLAQVLFTHELAKRLEGTGVTVNAVHPGAVASNWGRHDAGALSFALKFAAPFEKSVKQGADTSIYLASAPEVQNITGKYFFKRRERNSSKESYDDSAAAKLWQLSASMAKVG